MMTITFKDNSIIELNQFQLPKNQFAFYYRESAGYQTLTKWKLVNTYLSTLSDIATELKDIKSLKEFKIWNHESTHFP